MADEHETPVDVLQTPVALDRRRRVVELTFGKVGDFDEASLEWRRLFSELLGTFFLVLVGAGGVVVAAQSGGAVERAPRR